MRSINFEDVMSRRTEHSDHPTNRTEAAVDHLRPLKIVPKVQIFGRCRNFAAQHPDRAAKQSAGAVDIDAPSQTQQEMLLVQGDANGLIRGLRTLAILEKNRTGRRQRQAARRQSTNLQVTTEAMSADHDTHFDQLIRGIVHRVRF